LCPPSTAADYRNTEPSLYPCFSSAHDATPSPRASDAQSISQSLHVQTREDWSHVTPSRDWVESDSHTAIRLLDWLGRSYMSFHSPFDRALTPCRRIPNNKHITFFLNSHRTFSLQQRRQCCETPCIVHSCGALLDLSATAFLFYCFIERPQAPRLLLRVLIVVWAKQKHVISLDGRSSALVFPPAHQCSRCPTWCPQGGATRTQGSATRSRNRTSQPPEAKPPGLRCLIYHHFTSGASMALLE
jgi:hypothetical protein